MNLKDKISQFLCSGAILSIDRDSILIGYGESAWKKFEEINKHKPAFYFPDFFLSKQKPWLQFSQTETICIQDLIELIGSTNSKVSIKWQNHFQDHFFYTFDSLQSDFTQNKLQKAVPYIFAQSDAYMNSQQLQRSLRQALQYALNYKCHVYGFWDINEGILGVTPELLFEYKHIQDSQQKNSLASLYTVALAGTCPKDECLEAFKSNPKELREHQIAIDGIKQSLQHFGHVAIGSTSVLELPNLNHLMTPLVIELSQPSRFEDIILNLHPTPALGAYPRENGWKWLKSYQEKIDRQRFGAPVGVLYSQNQKAKCCVAIRNVQWDRSGMKIGAGCGVIKESECQKEWSEIQLKLAATQELLAL